MEDQNTYITADTAVRICLGGANQYVNFRSPLSDQKHRRAEDIHEGILFESTCKLCLFEDLRMMITEGPGAPQSEKHLPAEP